MTVQLPLPGVAAWPRNALWRDPAYMLSDLFYEKEGELRREIEEDIEREE